MYILNIHIHFSILWAFFENACVSLLNQLFSLPAVQLRRCGVKFSFSDPLNLTARTRRN